MAKLFGFSIEDSKKKSAGIVSPVPQTNEDGVDNYIASGFYGQYVDIEGAYKNEHELIKRYREMALHPEADGAIEDVVNEAIVSDLYDSQGIQEFTVELQVLWWEALKGTSPQAGGEDIN